MTQPCLVCDSQPIFAWTDQHGEGYCIRCGTPYQLINGILGEGETYPRVNIKLDAIPVLRRYWEETSRGNGLGTWLAHPRSQGEDRVAFNEWCDEHPDELATANADRTEDE